MNHSWHCDTYCFSFLQCWDMFTLQASMSKSKILSKFILLVANIQYQLLLPAGGLNISGYFGVLGMEDLVRVFFSPFEPEKIHCWKNPWSFSTFRQSVS